MLICQKSHSVWYLRETYNDDWPKINMRNGSGSLNWCIHNHSVHKKLWRNVYLSNNSSYLISIDSTASHRIVDILNYPFALFFLLFFSCFCLCAPLFFFFCYCLCFFHLAWFSFFFNVCFFFFEDSLIICLYNIMALMYVNMYMCRAPLI